MKEASYQSKVSSIGIQIIDRKIDSKNINLRLELSSVTSRACTLKPEF